MDIKPIEACTKHLNVKAIPASLFSLWFRLVCYENYFQWMKEWGFKNSNTKKMADLLQMTESTRKQC